MLNIILSVFIAFTITFFCIPVVIFVAARKKLYDVPDARKIHTAPISSLGGFAIFAGFILSSLSTASFLDASEFQYIIASSLIIFFLGLKDDILVISPLKKFIGQLLAAALIIHKGGIQISNMHGFLGVYELPEMYSLLITYFTIVLIINSFNLIDGIDGLAGCLGLMVTTVLGLYFLKAGFVPYTILSFSLAGSIAAFLIFNFQPAKIFMGDTGSLLIGLINAVLVIKFIDIAPGSVDFPIKASPGIGFSILIIPLLDTLRVFCIRILNRRSPFSPDKNHIHHILLDKGLSHREISLTLLTVNVLFIVLAYSGMAIGSTGLISLSVLVFFSAIGLLKHTRSRRQVIISTPVKTPSLRVITPSKIINLVNGTNGLEEN